MTEPREARKDEPCDCAKLRKALLAALDDVTTYAGGDDWDELGQVMAKLVRSLRARLESSR